MRPVSDRIIPPASSLAFPIMKGQVLRITDTEGKQVGDFVLFNEDNLREHMCPTFTRMRIRSGLPPNYFFGAPGTRIPIGSKLISNIHKEMMTIIADTQIPSGVHDLSARCCSSWVYDYYGVGPRDGCLELLAKALKPWGMEKEDVPPNMNVFMNIPVDPKTGMCYIEEPLTRPGDYIEFRAEIDCLGALSTCPENVINKCNGTPPHPQKPLRIQICDSE